MVTVMICHFLRAQLMKPQIDHNGEAPCHNVNRPSAPAISASYTQHAYTGHWVVDVICVREGFENKKYFEMVRGPFRLDPPPPPRAKWSPYFVFRETIFYYF